MVRRPQVAPFRPLPGKRPWVSVGYEANVHKRSVSALIVKACLQEETYIQRREFLGLLGAAATTWPLAAGAQKSQAPRHIGLMANLPLPPVQRFRQRLQNLGYIEGKNLVIEYRYGEGRDDRFTTFAAEL